jgi:hypothetical protein
LIYRIILLFITLFTINIASAEELKTISAEGLISQNPSFERKEIVNFIIHQFDDKKDQKISQKEIDKLWNNKQAKEAFMATRFQIIDQQLYADSFELVHQRFKALRKFLQQLIRKYKINDVDFIVYTSDEIRGPQELKEMTLSFPAFMMSKDLSAPYERDKLLIPDSFVITDNWYNLTNQIKQTNLNSPWDQKINKIFWRGATSGAAKTPYTIDNFDKLPRLTLVMLSKSYPDLIDAKFSSYDREVFTKNTKKIESFIKDDLHQLNEVDHLEYKYLISIDGNNCAWRRVPWIMLSNSVLIKQETSKIQWFYPAIKPYFHYVPVKENLSNIFSQFQWMKQHDLESKIISLNATNFVENNLMLEDIEAHMVLILNEYHKLHMGEKIKATLPPYNQEPSMSHLLYSLFTRIKNQLIWWIESFF